MTNINKLFKIHWQQILFKLILSRHGCSRANAGARMRVYRGFVVGNVERKHPRQRYITAEQRGLARRAQSSTLPPPKARSDMDDNLVPSVPKTLAPHLGEFCLDQAGSLGPWANFARGGGKVGCLDHGKIIPRGVFCLVRGSEQLGMFGCANLPTFPGKG